MATTNKPDPPSSRTLAYQTKLPKLPIPPLEDTCRRYLRALEALQDQDEHEATKKAVQDFLENDGPVIQEKLKTWAEDKDRYAYRTALGSFLTSVHSVISKSFGTWLSVRWLLVFTVAIRYESYLSHSDPVVLALNPFFVLEYVFLTYDNCDEAELSCLIQERPDS